jgi:hypothetical protein
MGRDIRRNVVLFPLHDCSLDFSQASDWVSRCLGLTAAEATILVMRPTFVRLQCATMKTKTRLLQWASRTAVAIESSVRIREDLFKFERQQKKTMWPVMQALHTAGLRPSWKRASVTWRHCGTWFTLQPGEIHPRTAAKDIVAIAKLKCGMGCTDNPAIDEPSKAEQPVKSCAHVASQPASDVGAVLALQPAIEQPTHAMVPLAWNGRTVSIPAAAQATMQDILAEFANIQSHVKETSRGRKHLLELNMVLQAELDVCRLKEKLQAAQAAAQRP